MFGSQGTGKYRRSEIEAKRIHQSKIESHRSESSPEAKTPKEPYKAHKAPL